VVKSNRIYVEQTLRNVDGIIVLNIAKNLNLLSLDLIEIDIPNKASTEFVTQQINKCKTKISQADYDGAITNARTLIEEILINIETNIIGERQKYDGDLPKLYKRIAKLINLYPDKDVENSLNEILRGFISVINGFSGISNSIADRHATSKHPKLHHAKIAVNSSMIICEFILESYEYQQSKTYNPLNPSAQTTNR